MRAAMKIFYVIESVAMGVCIGYTLICWTADLGHFGNMHPGVRYHLLFSAGLVSTGVGFAFSLMAHRHRPVVSRVTMAACLLWGVWALLPRL